MKSFRHKPLKVDSKSLLKMCCEGINLRTGMPRFVALLQSSLLAVHSASFIRNLQLLVGFESLRAMVMKVVSF
jgi:hypothetical protein